MSLMSDACLCCYGHDVLAELEGRMRKVLVLIGSRVSSELLEVHRTTDVHFR